MRRRHVVVGSLLSATVMAGAVHPPAARIPGSDRVVNDPDAYDVYAALLQARRDSGGPDAGEYVIRRETLPMRTGCAVRGEPTDPAWRPALADYLAVNADPHLLVEGYAFDRPYTLVADAELHEATAPDTSKWEGFYRRYPSADGYVTFSNVGFSPDRTRAVVYVEHACAPLCGGARLEFLQYHDGRWRPLQVAGVRTCGWIS